MTDPTPRPYPRPAAEHLRQALAEQAPARIAQDAIHLEELTTRPQLEALAARLEGLHVGMALGEVLLTRRDSGARDDSSRPASVEDLRRAADVVKAAALHGYPRPVPDIAGSEASTLADSIRWALRDVAAGNPLPDARCTFVWSTSDLRLMLAALEEVQRPATDADKAVAAAEARAEEAERLLEEARAGVGQALAIGAAAIPGARASDPGTSHAAAASIPLVKRGNMLGRLLVGFRVFDRMHADHGDWHDGTLTSEELALRLNLEHTEYAKRCSDLLRLGYIRVAQDDDGHDRTRAGRSGRQRLVFELTDDGRRVADALRFDH